MSTTAQELINIHGLLPHPEGGFYKETHRSEYSTGIFYLLTKGSFSGLHKIKSDEMWHFYAGDALIVVEITGDGEIKETTLDSKNVQYVVPANTWFGAYLPQGSEMAFCGCTVAPAFQFKDFELATRERMKELYPNLYHRLEKMIRL